MSASRSAHRPFDTAAKTGDAEPGVGRHAADRITNLWGKAAAPLQAHLHSAKEHAPAAVMRTETGVRKAKAGTPSIPQSAHRPRDAAPRRGDAQPDVGRHVADRIASLYGTRATAAAAAESAHAQLAPSVKEHAPAAVVRARRAVREVSTPQSARRPLDAEPKRGDAQPDVGRHFADRIASLYGTPATTAAAVDAAASIVSTNLPRPCCSCSFGCISANRQLMVSGHEVQCQKEI